MPQWAPQGGGGHQFGPQYGFPPGQQGGGMGRGQPLLQHGTQGNWSPGSSHAGPHQWGGGPQLSPGWGGAQGRRLSYGESDQRGGFEQPRLSPGSGGRGRGTGHGSPYEYRRQGGAAQGHHSRASVKTKRTSGAFGKSTRPTGFSQGRSSQPAAAASGRVRKAVYSDDVHVRKAVPRSMAGGGQGPVRSAQSVRLAAAWAAEAGKSPASTGSGQGGEDRRGQICLLSPASSPLVGKGGGEEEQGDSPKRWTVSADISRGIVYDVRGEYGFTDTYSLTEVVQIGFEYERVFGEIMGLTMTDPAIDEAATCEGVKRLTAHKLERAKAKSSALSAKAVSKALERGSSAKKTPGSELSPKGTPGPPNPTAAAAARGRGRPAARGRARGKGARGAARGGARAKTKSAGGAAAQPAAKRPRKASAKAKAAEPVAAEAPPSG